MLNVAVKVDGNVKTGILSFSPKVNEMSKNKYDRDVEETNDVEFDALDENDNRIDWARKQRYKQQKEGKIDTLSADVDLESNVKAGKPKKKKHKTKRQNLIYDETRGEMTVKRRRRRQEKDKDLTYDDDWDDDN